MRAGFGTATSGHGRLMTQPTGTTTAPEPSSPAPNPGQAPTDPDTEGNPVTPPNPAENPPHA